MTKEELMRPRYKVIVKAPGCFKVGTIIEKHKYASGNWYVPNYMYDPEEYPDVFKKLEWWEDRGTDEMPEYLKNGSEVVKVHKYVACGKIVEFEDGTLNGLTDYWLPASQDEYEQYQSQCRKI